MHKDFAKPKLHATHARRLRRAAAAMLAVWVTGSAVADGFDVRIDDVSGCEDPWPLVVGLPFPQGALRDASAIRIVNADGAEVPVQVDPTATWRDGSLQWALAGFTANPQAAYRVEFGAGVKRTAPPTPLRIEHASDGSMTIDTGAAVYTFRPDRLLPDRAVMGTAVVLEQAGAGAYLVDNRGREGRVAGAAAEVDNAIVLAGPARAVIRRTGWYVTKAGERLARAEVWFYFAGGSPYLRMTHSLLLTEDTNELWIRDYGLEFHAPAAPGRAHFAIGAPGEEELVEVALEGGSAYMLQETYPHFLERESRAVVARLKDGQTERAREGERAGDWADASFEGYGLTVVMPWLAQQFPKEIAFGPDGAKASLWSGRCGREFDFRARTLVREYWGRWIDGLVEKADANIVPWIRKYWTLDREPKGAEALAEWPSNAQGAARTHDLWLLPRRAGEDAQVIRARAVAAARPPLALAEPAWLCATEAIGWPMHPKDTARFERAESVLSAYWEGLMAQFETLPRTGLIAWGSQPYLHTGKLFRHGILADYGLRRSVWGLYVRSGERRYYDYGARFNRHIGDWWVTHWTAGSKFRGGFSSPGGYWEGHMPFIWGDRSVLSGDSSGHDVHNWLMEYYLTGDEYALHLHTMIGKAVKERWDANHVRTAPIGRDGLERWDIPLPLRCLASFHMRNWDPEFGTMARDLAARLIDLESPNGLTGLLSGGPLYKWTRNVHALYEYYRATGDETARTAILKALDYKYRFNLVGPPYDSTNHGAFLFAMAYRWTGNPNYLRLMNHLVEQGLAAKSLPRGPHTNAHTTMGLPTALGLLAKIDAPIAPFPVLEYTQDDRPRDVPFQKAAGRPENLRVYAELSPKAHEADAMIVRVEDANGKALEQVHIEEERVFVAARGSQFPRKRHIQLSLPAEVPAGMYTLTLPNAARVRILESSAAIGAQ